MTATGRPSTTAATRQRWKGKGPPRRERWRAAATMAATAAAAEPPLAGALETGAIVGKRAEHAAACTDCASTGWPLPPSIYSDL